MTQERKHIISENYKRITEKIENAKARRDSSVKGEYLNRILLRSPSSDF